MSTDVEGIVKGFFEAHELWANSIQIIIATYLLESQLGLSCIGPVLVAAFATVALVKVSALGKKAQMKWVAQIQKRVGITTAMIGSMRGIKMSGLSEKLEGLIANLRVKELEAARSSRNLASVGSSLAYVPLMISPVITFGLFTIVALKDNTTLDASRLFTSLSVLLLLTQPLFTMYAGLMDLLAKFACLERIEKFLLAPSRADHRLMLPTDRSSSISSYEALTTENNDEVEMTTLSKTYSHQKSTLPEEVVQVRDGSFGWDQAKTPILHDISFKIPSAKLTLIVGPVGSGKSTLLKALLGETPSSKGFVHLATHEIAWCEQTPWLINASVQKNIIGFSDFDQDLYNKVLYCTDLESDISLFPDGDQTLIGSKGVTLSGGQKQRLAIARAVYSRRTIAIFDDVFSGLDATTEQRVFSRLFGSQGLLRQWKTTVIIATHAVNLLPSANHIIALDENGTISEQGSFSELNSANGYVRSFYMEHRHDSTTDSDSNSGTTSKAPLTKGSRVTTTVVSADKARQVGDFSVYRYYFATLGWKYTTLFFLMSASWAFFTTFPTVWLKWWSDSNAINPNTQTGLYLGVFTTLQVLGLGTNAVLVWFTFNAMAVRSGIKLHGITLKTVMSAPLAFFSTTDTGTITTRFSQDIQLLDMSLPLAVMCVVGNLFICIAQAALIASATYYIAISFPALIAVFYFLQKYYLRTSRQLRFLDLEQKAPVYTQFIEALAGLATIRAFSWQKKSIELNHDLVDGSQRPFYLQWMMMRWLTLVLDLITAGLAIIVVGIAVSMRGTISVGFTGVSLVQIISFTGYMKTCLSFWTQMETSIGAVARIKMFSAQTKVESLPQETLDPPPEWPSSGRIQITNVSASYSTEAEHKALNNINLTIEAGQRIGICGRTGSGKSSLVLALFRMIELSSGDISIDDLDISVMPRHFIRSRLNALSQDPFFLAGTVRMNLDPYETTADDQLTQALQKVQLWNIIEDKGGLDADLSIDMLSHGQRQLFCLARAILRPGKIVVLDEATSSVDRDTDKLMQQIIRTEFKHHTIIAIAHRLDTILDFDRIVVMEEGFIAESDTPAKLLESNSKFKALYDAADRDNREDAST